jgi:hypothetical protein
MMTSPTHKPDLASRLIAISKDLTATHAALTALAAELLNGNPVDLQSPVQQGNKHPVKALPTRAEMIAAHRRAHRPGRPGKIESDPELEAFILARIETLTFAQIVTKVRATFPPDRHCTHSGLGRWWQKRQGQ